MNEEAILADVTAMMREYFDDEALIVTRDTKMGDVPGWDSLSHVNLLISVEHHFDVRFASSELDGLDTIDRLVTAVAAKAP